MTEILIDNAVLLPFLFAAYVLMEFAERHSGVFVRMFGGGRRLWARGPVAGALAGLVPQCGMSATAASLFAGGMVSAGTMVSVFLSTSDEALPVLLSKGVPVGTVLRIVALKAAFAALAGLAVNAVAMACGGRRDGESGKGLRVGSVCMKAGCGCGRHGGIVVPALVHTVRMFVFLLVSSMVIEWLIERAGGEHALRSWMLNRPFAGEVVGGALGLVPNCAVSAACAEMYVDGAMSPGALLASSLTGCGVGMLVLFRTSPGFSRNMCVLLSVYVLGVLFGMIGGCLF